MKEGEPNSFQNETNEQMEPKKAGIKIERMTNLDEETLEQIYQLEKACFPEEMMTTKEELREILEDPSGIHLIVKNQQEIIGHISAIKHNEEYDYMIGYDPKFEKKENALHVDSIDIVPGKRRVETLKSLWDAFIKEAIKEGFEEITMYARVSNGLSKIVQKKCGAKYLRRMKDWYGMGEEFDYLEIDLPKK